MKFYTETHEWIEVNDRIGTVGITDYAQSQLGDVVFVELPDPGTELEKGAAFGVVESVKAASDLFSPVKGKVVEVNGELSARPELVNKDPEGEGWMIRLEIDPSGLSDLMDEQAYKAYLEGLKS